MFVAAALLQQRSDFLLQPREHQTLGLDLLLPQQRLLLENLHLSKETTLYRRFKLCFDSHISQTHLLFQVSVAPHDQQHVVTDGSVFVLLHSLSFILQDTARRQVMTTQHT